MADTKKMIIAPLLDRLIDNSPFSSSEPVPKRAFSRKKFRRKLLRDLLWLLNTRTPRPQAFEQEGSLTVIDYGIPDFGTLLTSNPADKLRLRRMIEKAVAAFEPRLSEARLEIRPVPGETDRLGVVIRGMLEIGTRREAVAFGMYYDRDGERFSAYEADA